MTLTLTDVTANVYAASRTVAPREVGPNYAWLLVSSHFAPLSGHLMRFQANLAASPSTDWYIDQAMMVPSGSVPINPSSPPQ